MNLLAELHAEPDLKLNLKFEIEVSHTEYRTYIGVEMKWGGGGGLYLPSRLVRYLHWNFVGKVRDRGYSKGGGGTLTCLGKFFLHDGMYARKRPLPLCVLCG